MLGTMIYNIYTEHTKHEYTMESSTVLLRENGTERAQPNLYL